ncbi:MAG: hypothetical protein EBR82_19000 [Caulobacteraceae bacterium]|nr:hypothetical protein [Caulobacteraceae bacterium]
MANQTYAVSGAPIDSKLDDRFAPRPRLPISQWSANKEAAANAVRWQQEGRYSSPDRNRNIALAKADGTFDALRERFNSNNRDRAMDENGNIVVTRLPAAVASTQSAGAVSTRLPTTTFTSAEPIATGTASFSTPSAPSVASPAVVSPAAAAPMLTPSAAASVPTPSNAGSRSVNLGSDKNDAGKALMTTVQQAVKSSVGMGTRALAAEAIPAVIEKIIPATQTGARLSAMASQVPVTASRLPFSTAARNAGGQIVNTAAKVAERAYEAATVGGGPESVVSRQTFKQGARAAAVRGLGQAALQGANRANLVGSALWEGNKLVGKAHSDRYTGDLTAAQAVGYALSGQTPEGLVKDEVAPQDVASTKAFDKLMSARKARANITDPERASKIDDEIVKRTAALKEAVAKRVEKKQLAESEKRTYASAQNYLSGLYR